MEICIHNNPVFTSARIINELGVTQIELNVHELLSLFFPVELFKLTIKINEKGKKIYIYHCGSKPVQ